MHAGRVALTAAKGAVRVGAAGVRGFGKGAMNAVAPAGRTQLNDITQVIGATVAGVKQGIDDAVQAAKAGVQPGAEIGAVGPPELAGVGTRVYRVWGGQSRKFGKSWTDVDPRTVPDYRNVAGLPTKNKGRYLTEGVLQDAAGVERRAALPLDGNTGGHSEVLIPDPKSQVVIVKTTRQTPQF